MIERLDQDLNFEVFVVHPHISYLFLVTPVSDGLNFELKAKEDVEEDNERILNELTEYRSKYLDSSKK